MKKRIVWLYVLLALIFVVLFFARKIGLNLVLFEAVVIPIIVLSNRSKKINYLYITILVSVILTLLMTQLWNSFWAKIVNALLVLALAEIAVLPENRSFCHVMIFAVGKAFTSQIEVFENPDCTRESYLGIRLKHFLWMLLIPIVVITLFILIYVWTNDSVVPMVQPIENVFVNFFHKFDSVALRLVLYFIFGLIICNALFVRTKRYGFFDHDQSDALSRVKIKYGRRALPTGLKLKNRSGIIILVLLNILILVFNFIDISTLLFGSDLDVSLLKEYVHQGVTVLIISVLLSMSVVMCYFCKNLNFYYKVKPFRSLVVLWIAQNILLALLVGVRIFRYIHYFGLAFGRIAVLFFLASVIFGMITIIIKIVKLKSTFFLWRINSYGLLLFFVIATCFNWNAIIAKYNIGHCETAFVDYKFLATRLNNSALPILVESIENSDYIETQQNRAFSDLKKQPYYWTKDEYVEYVLVRKNDFMKSYREESWLEWNISDWLTYRKLLKMEDRQ